VDLERALVRVRAVENEGEGVLGELDLGLLAVLLDDPAALQLGQVVLGVLGRSQSGEQQGQARSRDDFHEHLQGTAGSRPTRVTRIAPGDDATRRREDLSRVFRTFWLSDV